VLDSRVIIIELKQRIVPIVGDAGNIVWIGIRTNFAVFNLWSDRRWTHDKSLNNHSQLTRTISRYGQKESCIRINIVMLIDDNLDA
jgi:hypothetical protein